ncbi:hypothetical protein D3C72_1313540 [compost metagenome]
MADLVRRQMAQALIGQTVGIVLTARAAPGDADQPLEDHLVLTVAQRTQLHHAAHDLAGARIVHAGAGGPAARLAVDPRHDAVARVHRMRPFGQQLDPEGVDIARIIKGLFPPVAALDQGLLDGGRGGAVDIEDDGFLDRRARGARINLLQPEAAGQTADHRLIQGGGEIRHQNLPRGARARIVRHRDEAFVR